MEPRVKEGSPVSSAEVKWSVNCPYDPVKPKVLGKFEEDWNGVWTCIKTGNCDRTTHSFYVCQNINMYTLLCKN